MINKLILKAFYITLFPLFFCLTSTSISTTNSTEVYLCDSKYGEKYHFSSNCRGLKACKNPIIKVTLSEAKKRGKTICGYED